MLDPFRFGVFKYDNGAHLQFGQTENRIPKSARDIIIDLQPYGFKAKYFIDRKEIEEFNELQWNSWKGMAVNVRGSSILGLDEIAAKNEEFLKYGWKVGGNVLFINGPRGSNGKGYDILYSVTDSVAIQNYSYW